MTGNNMTIKEITHAQRILTETLEKSEEFKNLTTRERDLLLCAAVTGDSGTAIAKTFGIAEGTWRNHMANINRKTGMTRDRAVAALWVEAVND